MIPVDDKISIDQREIEFNFVRASGPGGQHVNKVASAVQLRFDVKHSPSLPQPVRARLLQLAGKRISQEGVLILEGDRYRKQHLNRRDVLDRLVELIRQATYRPKSRIPTRPSKVARERRIMAKRHRSRVKKLRQPVRSPQD